MILRRRVVGWLALLTLLAGCTSAPPASTESADSSLDPNASAALPSTGPAASSTSPDHLSAAVDIVTAGGSRLDVDAADWIQTIDGSAWTTLASDNAVRLDTTGATTATVATGGPVCLAMDVGFDSLWIGVCSNPARILRVDPRSATVIATIPLPGVQLEEEGSLAAGADAVWAVTSGPEKELLKIDPTTNTLVGGFPLPAGAAGARAGLGGLWVTDPAQGQLLRLDPLSGHVVATVDTGAGARFFAVGEGGVWVQNNGDGSVSHVDPVNNQVVATIKVDDGRIEGGDLAVGGGFVWARITDGLIAKIDPATDSVVDVYGPRSGSGSVAADSAAVWVTAHDVNAVFRLPLG